MMDMDSHPPIPHRLPFQTAATTRRTTAALSLLQSQIMVLNQIWNLSVREHYQNYRALSTHQPYQHLNR